MQALKTPNVYRQEKDQSEVTAPAGTSVGAIVGSFRQGMVNQRMLMTNDKQLIDTVGTPNPDGEDVAVYAGMEFLKESDSLYVVRATKGTEQYACISATTSATTAANGGAILALSSTGFEQNTPTVIADLDDEPMPTGAKIMIASIGPGTYGNLIGITLETSASPTSSDWSNKYDATISGTVFKLSVFVAPDANTTLTSAAQAEEVFYASTLYQKDGEGKQLFIEDVINGKSKYIYVNCVSGGTALGIIKKTDGSPVGSPVMLQNGVDATFFNAGQSSVTNAWNLFVDKVAVSVNILIDVMKVSLEGVVPNIVAQRLDCIACVQAGDSDELTVAAIKAGFPTGMTLPSYAAVYGGWDKIYDSFNDRYVLIPKCVYGAVVMARTDRVAKTWDAPAGMNRGILPSIGQNVIFSDTDIGNLYDVNINTSKFIRGTGNVLWGQKTAQKKKSALDRINVRRLLLYIENSIEPSLLPFLFEPNDTKVRLRAWGIVDDFMKGVLAGGGVTKYEVVCDDTNNTPQTIDNNELILDVYVQRTKTIEFIRLNIIVTRTGVNFAEIR